MAYRSTSPDTIFALSSAPGRAGVAVLRVSGPASRDVVQQIAGCVPDPRTAALRTFRDVETGKVIDKGLVVWFPGPGSFTGEDCAEFQVHGGRAVVAAMLGVFAKIDGCRMAEAGEFACRAFDNGKIDLAQAEGLADLIDAETEAQRVQALRQAEGALTGLTERWRHELIGAMALVEAGIDFSDEGDVSDSAVAQAEEAVARLSREILERVDDQNRGEILREGFQVVLAGAPNVGKSSLLNALAQRDVAIVSAQAGTTRDVIEVRLDLGGVPVVISDTAGLREAGDEVEREGMKRTLKRAKRADLVIWVDDRPIPKLPEAPTGRPERGFGVELADLSGSALLVASKADEVDRSSSGGAAEDDYLEVSTKSDLGLKELVERISGLAVSRAGSGEDSVVTQARHRQHIERCLAHLERFAGMRGDIELRAEELRLAADALGRISGRVDPEDVLDQVFGRFCIGK
ncbi:MAG: tRNA uridine-5-carboxymethylaminomethyl(34) synthesis GTPase MnmE [Filomicrobium sp.]